MKKQLVIFGIAVLLIGIALSGCVNENSVNENKKTMTYAKLMSDIKPLPGTDNLFTLQSYNDSEVLYIEDTVYNVSYFEISESEKYTLVSFSNSTSLEGIPIGIKGDKRSEYPVGSAVSITVHVKNYVINGTAVTWLEEGYNYISAYISVSGMLTPTSTGKTMSAIQQSVDTTAHTVTYRVTSTDAGIAWSEVTGIWSNSIGQQGSATITHTDLSTDVTVGQLFTVSVGATAGICSIDLIYNGHIIWTGPTVST